MTDKKIQVAVVGYGNVGQAVARVLEKTDDMELAGIITRRAGDVRKIVSLDIPVYVTDPSVVDSIEGIDVAILCGGSATDLPEQGPFYVSRFSTVDSFDTHAKIPEYYADMDKAAKAAGTVAILGAGWHPGTFSDTQVRFDAFFPDIKSYIFYGLSESGGLSQGHSEAIRGIKGVADARQYTHAKPEAIYKVLDGQNPVLTDRDKHWRECFVVLEEGANEAEVERKIKEMPDYFEPYETQVHFITQVELDEKYFAMLHDGEVIIIGETGPGNSAVIKYSNSCESNPEFTSRILIPHARAAVRLANQGAKGAFTTLDISAALLNPRSRVELLKHFV